MAYEGVVFFTEERGRLRGKMNEEGRKERKKEEEEEGSQHA